MPLIVPEVNPDAIAGYDKQNIIANPNCSTAQLVVALKPLHDAPRSSASWWRPTSRSPAPARTPWTSSDADQGASTRQDVEPKKFTKQIAFNVIPHIDVFMEDGYTKEEWKMMVETKKILDPKIKLTATCVRVPVFVGHSEAVNIEFENPITADEAREILREAPGFMVIDKREDGGYITPIECVGEFATYVSRIREDPTVENGLSLWVVSRQSAQGRGAQRRADRGTADQPQADPGQAESGVGTRLPGAREAHAWNPAASSKSYAGSLYRA